jgi:hypothetical protein
MGRNYVGDLAQHILATINEKFAEEEVSLPSLQIITLGGRGATSQLCEQISISIEQLYSGLPGDQAQQAVRCNAPQSAVFAVELVRCLPSSMPKGRSTPIPAQTDAAQQTEAALSLMHDMQILIDAGMQACQSQWTQSGIVDVTTVAPDGGFQTIIMNVICAIGDA